MHRTYATEKRSDINGGRGGAEILIFARLCPPPPPPLTIDNIIEIVLVLVLARASCSISIADRALSNLGAQYVHLQSRQHHRHTSVCPRGKTSRRKPLGSYGAIFISREEVNRIDNFPHILQHFQYAVMSSVEILGKSAFPAEITRYLMKSSDRPVSLAQVFTALERLEDKGLLSHRDLDPEPVRGGRRRKLFQLEASGVRVLRATAATIDQMPTAAPKGRLPNGITQHARPRPA